MLKPVFDFATPGNPPDYIYILGVDQQPANGPWVGAFAYGVNRSVKMPTLSLADFFGKVLGNPQGFQHAGFLFLQKPPDQTAAPAFRTSLLAAAKSFPAWGSSATLGGFTLWLDTFGAFDLSSPGLIFPGRNLGNGTCEYDLQTQPYRLFDAGGTARTVFFDASSLGPNTILAAGNDAITLRLDRSASLSFGDTTPKRPAVTLSTVTIPLTGPTAGCFTFTGTNAGALTDFDFGFQYAIAVDNAQPTRLACPLLDKGETLAGAAVSGAIDTVGSTSAVRNTLQITPAGGGTFTSAYRTIWDEKIILQPTNGAQFIGAAAADPSLPARLYFIPAGDFTMTVPNAALPDHRLLCGFTAIENIAFSDGDLLRFTASTHASISVTSAGSGTYAFADSNSTQFGTAWAATVSATQYANVYWSESESSPFFNPPDDGTSAQRLVHHGFAMRGLPDPRPQDNFPLLPYAAVTQLDGFAGQQGGIAAFEAGYVSPTRGTLIRALPAQPMKPLKPTKIVKIALTPQGYLVGFNDQGAVASIELGSAAGCRLLFAEVDGSGGPTGTALPDAIRDTFLAPQQFVVATCNTDLFQKYAHVSLSMSGWAFGFAPPPVGQGSPGDYKSVLIIKSVAAKKIGNTTLGSSVASLAASPTAWTGYDLFNDTAVDPTGQVLSSWLTSYIANAMALWNDNKGLAGLQTFCELVVEDNYWNGFLFLRIPVSPAGLDPQLSFLLAGADISQLEAHHIGCAVNHVEVDPTVLPPTLDTYEQDSSFFGLVHYLKPGATPGSIQAMAYVPSSVPYDFQLLALEVVFENSALQSFSSSAILVLNTLFGDSVLSNHNGDGPVATNTLLIQGALQTNSGTPTYVFATAPGATSTFYLSSSALDHIEIDRALVIQNGEVNFRSSVTFQMTGWMATLASPADDTTPPFDLLSYAALSFINFGLQMTYNSNDSKKTPGGDKQFAPDLSKFALTPLADKEFTGTLVDTAAATANTLYRTSSLVASFPMALKGFVIGAISQTPTAMGYRALSTYPSTNGSDPSGEWYGLAFDLPLGGSGSLDAAGLINANLMFTWTAGGAGTPAFAPYIKLTGPGGVNLSFDLEGILKFGADGIYLSQPGTGQNVAYQLTFASIGVTVFTKTFPPKGSTNITIAGFEGRNVGWFGAYSDPNAPPMKPTQVAGGNR